MSKSLTTYVNEARQLGKRLNEDDVITYEDGTKVKMYDAMIKFRGACMYIFQAFPYFGPALKNLVPIWTNEINTMATDGIRLFMNPKFTAGLTDNQCVFVLLHECMHNILNHLVREKQAGHSDHERSNIAADYEVNGILEDDGLVKKGTTKSLKGYYSEKYTGWAYERIYNDCESSGSKPKQQGNAQSSQSGQSGQGGSGGGQGQQQQRNPDWVQGWNDAIADYNSGKLKI